ncbi:MAG: lmo0937 family membrane protein [Opitutaceae bacterium]|nr:lmo0937 family membrane protein [Opitutaceae bacterium]
MLEAIAIILVLMWLLGMVSSYTIGGYIHLLLLIALIAVILRLIRGRNPLR